MRFLFGVELILTVLFIYTVFTQLIIPMFRDTPIFPWLEDEKSLTKKLYNAKQDVVEAKIIRNTVKENVRAKTIKRESKEIRGVK